MVSNSSPLKLSAVRRFAPDREFLWAWLLALVLVFSGLVAALHVMNAPVTGWGALPTTGVIVVTTTLALRLVLWWCYRPYAPSADMHSLPSLTVVVPSYNEGPMVRRCLESILNGDYPKHLLHVIAVNDGSHDDTGAHIDAVAAANPDRVTVIHFSTNRGKRHALYEGFSHASSTLVATVDSDSLVPRDSLRALVAPFVDPKVGGVAGKVKVYNRRANFLTRMLGVRYILGFDFIRAYQSALRTVWCWPGALQAYRRDLIEPHLAAWRDQRFLGAQCTNGDDHAMTNIVLSLGFDTIYQSNAPVLTRVPTSYMGLCKMYIRWGRSATREGLRALKFAPRRAIDLGPLRGLAVLVDAVSQPLAIALRLAAFATVGWLLVTYPLAFASALAMTALVAVGYGLVYLRSERSSEVAFGICYAFFALILLPWVQPFATLTVRTNRWMTRG